MKNLITHLNESLRIGLHDKPEEHILDILNKYEYKVEQDKYNGLSNVKYSIFISGKDSQHIYNDICNDIIDNCEKISKKENIEKLIDNKTIASIHNGTKGELCIETKIFGNYYQLRVFLQSNKIDINMFLLEISENSNMSHTWEGTSNKDLYVVSNDLFNDISQFIRDNDEITKIDTILK